MSTDKLYFAMELHTFHGRLPWLELEMVAEGRPDFFVRDISNDFNAMPSNIAGVAFEINFCLPADFSGTEEEFELLKVLGLPRTVINCDQKADDRAVRA